MAMEPVQKTNVPVACKECKIQGFLNIGDLASRGDLLACFCNGKLPVSHPAQYEKIVSKLKEKDLSLVKVHTYEQYVALEPKSETKLDVKCAECGFVGTKTINNIKNGDRKLECACTGQLSVRSEAHFKKAQLKCSNKGIYMTDIDNFEDWKRNVRSAKSTVSVCCHDCGIDGRISVSQPPQYQQKHWLPLQWTTQVEVQARHSATEGHDFTRPV